MDRQERTDQESGGEREGKEGGGEREGRRATYHSNISKISRKQFTFSAGFTSLGTSAKISMNKIKEIYK